MEIVSSRGDNKMQHKVRTRSTQACAVRFVHEHVNRNCIPEMSEKKVVGFLMATFGSHDF